MNEGNIESAALRFFNYQEYRINDYEPFLKNGDSSLPLIATHFDNPYVLLNSKSSSDTRIVRIPRNYTDDAIVPQFSTCMPGFEPAALVDPVLCEINETNHKTKNLPRFIPRGKANDNNLYGNSSVSPLSNYLNQKEFKDIVDTINKMLMQAYEPFTWYNIVTVIFHFLTFKIFQRIGIFRDQASIILQKLDDHVTVLNDQVLESKNIRLIHPSKGGYLSLDFEVPCPKENS